MLTKDYFFDLPPSLIAQDPTERRGDERLLLMDRASGECQDKAMRDFPSLLDDGCVLVVNNSKVRKARLYGETESGGKVEFLFMEEDQCHRWIVMSNKGKKQKVGRKYLFRDKDGNVSAIGELVEILPDGAKALSFDREISEDFFETSGHVPLPPYIKREDKFSDESRYQTVYAKAMGSVAAPTAGLHFTKEILSEIKSRGIDIYEVTLHVGSGTFLPVRSENIEDHHMHYERYTISEETADALNNAKRGGKRIVAVGTTSVRTLESSAFPDGFVHAGTERTNIFIYPGFKFSFVDSLLTNFHTPESTLLMLVSAFAGKDKIMAAYKHAVDEKYRFFSYGDAMFIR